MGTTTFYRRMTCPSAKKPRTMNIDKFGYYKRNDTDADNEWFDRCQESQSPYIKVIYRTKFADIEWDYITFQRSLDLIFEDNRELLEEKARKIFDKYAGSRSSRGRIDEHIIQFFDIPINNSKQAATEVHDLIADIIEQLR